MAGIYIHIPFCRQKCRYCDFYSVASEKEKGPILQALYRELELRVDELYEPVKTLYFGGGTPTVYAPTELQSLIERVKQEYKITAFEEVTVEANPDDLTPEYLESLRQTDIHRLSIGIQSFDDDHLRFFNRRHTGQQACDAVRRAKTAGFENITADLIYGVPGMTDKQWEANLEKFLALDIPHLSAYHLTIEPRTVFGKWAEQGRVVPVTDEISERHYRILEDRMFRAGYRHYEISNFARPGYEARHNGSYWDGTPYIGIGPAAHSFDGHTRRWNTANNQAYLQNLPHGNYFDFEKLTQTDRFNEILMTGLRTAQGVSWEKIRREFDRRKVTCLRESSRKYLQNGLLVDADGFLAIPTTHFLLSDTIISDLFIA